LKVALFGKNGQLSWELQRTVPDICELVVFGSATCDIRNRGAVDDIIAETAPDLIINTAAYTAVDLAEEEQDQAFAVNSTGVANLARAAVNSDIRLVHISTDFVFDGRKSSPYFPEDTPNPLGVYGESKLEGEAQIAKELADNSLVIRTSWLYSAHGNNFVKTMLRLMGERDALSVVADQVGSPTWANGLAETIWLAVQKKTVGLHHWTDSGVASWYDFAVAIYEEALILGLIKKELEILPIRSDNYPTPARRPSYSVLDTGSIHDALDKTSPHWRVNLRKMLREVKREE
jgi:dTDP-4-dehydrorhamnose reductase